jgi:hypothetical protein
LLVDVQLKSVLAPGSGLRFSARAGKFLSFTWPRPALGPAYPGFKRPHFHQFENLNLILYRLFHIVNLATRFVKTVKAVSIHNFYSKHFLAWCARYRKTSLQSSSLPGNWANTKTKECSSNHHHVQISSGAHPAAYPMGTRGSFGGSKAAGE